MRTLAAFLLLFFTAQTFALDQISESIASVDTEQTLIVSIPADHEIINIVAEVRSELSRVDLKTSNWTIIPFGTEIKACCMVDQANVSDEEGIRVITAIFHHLPNDKLLEGKLSVYHQKPETVSKAAKPITNSNGNDNRGKNMDPYILSGGKKAKTYAKEEL